MKNKLLLSSLIFVSTILNAQDDIYDAPEPARIVTYSPPNTSNNSNNQQYQDDYDYNPNFDYQYSRQMRRLYDPYYMMPTSAYMNMGGYPGFSSFYNPYYWGGGSGFSISIGSGWGYNNWNNPYYSSFYSPWGFNSCQYGMGWNSWNNPWGYGYGYNNFYSPWGFNNYYSPYYYGSGYGNFYGYNDGSRYDRRNNNYRRPSRHNYNNVDGQPARSNIKIPQRRIQDPVRNVDRSRDFGRTYERPTPSNNNSSNTGGSMRQNRTVTTSPSPVPQNGSNTNNSSTPTRTGGGGSRNGGRF